MEKADVLQLTLGFVAVRNRSTDEKLTLEEARRREKEFFRQHPASSAVGWHCLGIDALIDSLADLYSDRVKETFPKMRQDIQKKLKDVREQLSKFPPDLETPSARLAKYYELADYYVENILKVRFSSSSDGQHVSMINTLHGIFKKFEGIIYQYTREFSSSNYHSKVRIAMTACFGEQLPNFLPHPLLKQLICEKLSEFGKATETLINECFRMTQRLLVDKDVDACKGDILLNKLLPAFRNIAVLYLNEKNRIIHEQLQELIRLEKHDPYTIDDYYTDKISVFKIHLAEQKSPTTTEKKPSLLPLKWEDQLMLKSILKEEPETQEMLISIYCYWKVLTKRFMDYAALSLRAGCVFDVCPGIREILRRVPTEKCDFVDSYLAEDVYIRTKRKQLQQTKERLEKVDAILGGQSVTDAGNDIFTDTMTVENGSLMTLDALARSLSQTAVDDGTSTISINSTFNLTTAGVNKTK
jgi:hypothetical protein